MHMYVYPNDMQTLREWLDNADITLIEFASKIGVTRDFVYKVIAGTRNPGKKVARAIKRITHNQVLIPTSKNRRK